jgi:hypothetical protein
MTMRKALLPLLMLAGCASNEPVLDHEAALTSVHRASACAAFYDAGRNQQDRARQFRANSTRSMGSIMADSELARGTEDAIYAYYLAHYGKVLGDLDSEDTIVRVRAAGAIDQEKGHCEELMP